MKENLTAQISLRARRTHHTCTESSNFPSCSVFPPKWRPLVLQTSTESVTHGVISSAPFIPSGFSMDGGYAYRQLEALSNLTSLQRIRVGLVLLSNRFYFH